VTGQFLEIKPFRGGDYINCHDLYGHSLRGETTSIVSHSGLSSSVLEERTKLTFGAGLIFKLALIL
jgi:hypothetical protein